MTKILFRYGMTATFLALLIVTATTHSIFAAGIALGYSAGTLMALYLVLLSMREADKNR